MPACGQRPEAAHLQKIAETPGPFLGKKSGPMRILQAHLFSPSADEPSPTHKYLSKLPEVTLVFWIIKIAATTLGETGGDAVTMSLNLGYLVGTAIFATIFVVAVSFQIAARRFHPFLYWFVIVATTTVGTTLADFMDRSLGIGYTGGSALLRRCWWPRWACGTGRWDPFR